MESAGFNEIFDVYAQDPHEAFYLLTPHFMEKLVEAGDPASMAGFITDSSIMNFMSPFTTERIPLKRRCGVR